MKTITVELTHSELMHLQNDLISYIWEIKEQVFGDAWSFGCNLSDKEKSLLDEEKEEKLKSYGYYSRLDLKNKLDRIEKENFSTLECSE